MHTHTRRSWCGTRERTSLRGGAALATFALLLLGIGAGSAPPAWSDVLSPADDSVTYTRLDIASRGTAHHQVSNTGAWVNAFNLPTGGTLTVYDGEPDPVPYVHGNGVDDLGVDLPIPPGDIGALLLQADSYEQAGRSPSQDRAIMDALEGNPQTCQINPAACIPTVAPDPAVGLSGSQAATSCCSNQEISWSGCAAIDGSVYWRGCGIQWIGSDRDPSAWYQGYQMKGTGHGKGPWYLKTGRLAETHKYGADPSGTNLHQVDSVIDWSPSGDMTPAPGSVCSTGTIGISSFFVISASVPVCRTKITMKDAPAGHLQSQWNGAVRATNVGDAQVITNKTPGENSWAYFYMDLYEYHSLFG